jgi:hypothetical protein
MANDPHASDRFRLVFLESICGAILVIGGVLLGRVGGIVDYVGLLLVFFGGWALVHAILVGSGLIKLPPPPPARDTETRAQPASVRARQTRIVRIEIVSCILCLALGAAFETGGHTLRDVSVGLFGWAAGSGAHLTLMLASSRLSKRRGRP